VEFDYEVQIGDQVDILDYNVTDAWSRSSVGAFNLRGGTIRRYSQAPIQDVDLHLNPTKAALQGEFNSTLFRGVAEFANLWIERRGADYKLHFYSNITGFVLQTSQVLSVAHSAEVEVRNDDFSSGDRFGWTMDIQGDYIVAGAPYRHKSVQEIQTIRSTGATAASDPVLEVQVVGTQVDFMPEIRTFETSAYPEESVGGDFYLAIADHMTPAIFAWVPASVLGDYIMQEYPWLGPVTVSRTDNTYCACKQAFRWTLTFATYQGIIPPIITIGSDLTGAGATISQMEVLQKAPVLGGYFSLVAFNRETRPLHYDIDTASFRQAVEEDLGFSVNGIMSDEGDVLLGRMWTIVFNSLEGNYDMPPLVGNSEHLIGQNARVWTHTALEGKGPLAGTFRLSFR